VQTDDSWISRDTLDLAVNKWKKEFDQVEGGANRAPKFPLPNNYEFLLNYAFLAKDPEVSEHVRITLSKMAFGGIYDQAGGGFSRYSVDMFWKVPHFEKMLYDNAQLISLYSKAYRFFGEPLYRHVVNQTSDWLDREMSAGNGAYFSALDADSEGEEGKFYVWQKDELKELTGDDFEFVKDLYSLDNGAHWEKGNYILLRKMADDDLMQKYGLTETAFREKTDAVNALLLGHRAKRVPPGLDDKCLTSWNAMLVSGFCEAAAAFGDEEYLKKAVQTMRFILDLQRRDDGGLNHTWKEGVSSVNGYLEDYAFTINALTDLYQLTFDEQWLEEARQLTDYTLAHFTEEETGLFYFTSDLDPPLIARKTEVQDNVIPSSNSAMANALFNLGHLFHNESYLGRARRMLQNVAPLINDYGPGYSNWAILILREVYPAYEVVITGPESKSWARQLQSGYQPGVLWLAAENKSNLPLFENRFFDGQTTIFVCENRACKMPVNSVEDALKQLRR
jgi:uncharacterized protein YyaL (SSP411 family)